MNPALILNDPAYRAFKRHIIHHTGLEYYADKDEDLATRVARRVAASGKNLPTYHALISTDSAEMDRLVGELTIGETYFFRQKEHFEVLRTTIIPALIEQNAVSRTIRIWSAGCAIGAEPYSIAMLLSLHFSALMATWDISILATDINTDFLSQARTGVFNDWALRDTPADIKALCFRPDGKKWRLLPELRNLVNFRYHNLATSADPAPDHLPFDLIICRNVLIYFSWDTIHTVAGRLHKNLKEGGWLLVGHAEPNAQAFEMFRTVSLPQGSAYRKLSHGAPEPAPVYHWEPEVQEVKSEFYLNLPAVPSIPPALHTVASAPPSLAVDDIRLLADSGRWETALNAADKLVGSEPLNAAAQFTLGLIHEHNGDHQQANTALRRAIYLDRTFALAHYHLGASLQTMGDRAGALKSFHNVVGLAGGIAPAEPVPHGDGITAQELTDLAKMHLESLV